MIKTYIKKCSVVFLTFVIVLVSTLPIIPAHAANQVITADLSSSTGTVMHGASGFLYGLADAGIPTSATLIPLSPQVTAQKPQGGSQHPNGDAFNVAPQFFAAGGNNVQIYMQDQYANWPYDFTGISDYLLRVDSMTRAVVADSNRSKYVYVPFNEPDWIWYSGNLSGLCNDWLSVYNKIRSIDSTAKIAGPNYSYYNSSDYKTFMTFCKNNNCLPDVVTWHELDGSIFSSWYDHYNDYRSIESSLGISARPIVINEYAQISGELGYPGKMIQYISRFENSKVYACRAYWAAAGDLDQLTVENNKANGDWWLYKWYGELTGDTVTVTPPTQNGSLQGLAVLDSTKKQARILFGGSSNTTDVVVKGFGSASYFGSSVHVMVWGVDSTTLDSSKGFAASTGPYLVQEGDYTVSNGQISVTVNGMNALSAYQMIVTPNKDLSAANTAGRYEAEYATLSGAAVIGDAETSYSGTGYVQGFGNTDSAAVTYVTTVPNDGYYNIKMRYSAGTYSGAPSTRYVQMKINDTFLKNVQCAQTANWSTWADVTTTVFLQGGINRITFSAYTNDESDCVNQDYIDVTAGSGTITSYEAEASENTLAGTVVADADSAASGGYVVGYIGNGAENSLQFNNVNVSAAGRYRMVVRYENAEITNSSGNTVNRTADITVNGTLQVSGAYFKNTFVWGNYYTTVIDLDLSAGNNAIKFSNSTAYAPSIDKISIATP